MFLSGFFPARASVDFQHDSEACSRETTRVDAECGCDLENRRQGKASSFYSELFRLVQRDAFEAVVVNESADDVHFAGEGGLLAVQLVDFCLGVACQVD